MKEKIDSRVETYKHKSKVQEYMNQCIGELIKRSLEHDDSKLASPEVEIFNEYTPKLKGCTYGSDEYKTYLKEMQVALDHHYANNDHHPEYHREGIKGMNLINLLEMVCDWIAATKRHADGDIYRSINISQKRFKFSDELKEIIKNTVYFLEKRSNNVK